jgi:molybdenum cofactor cytidylyltransferase
MITCILLSAGLSERFGSPKALANIAGKPVIQHVQHTLLQSSCDEIVVVLGAHADKIEPSIFIHSRIRVVYNKDYYFGQTSSVQTGWHEANDSSEGIMFLPVDCPLVEASSINAVIDHFKKHNPDILIPTYRHKKGHPPVFHRRLKSKILKLPMNLGLNSLFTEHPPQTVEIDDPGIIKSFNTPEEFEDIKNPGPQGAG